MNLGVVVQGLQKHTVICDISLLELRLFQLYLFLHLHHKSPCPLFLPINEGDSGLVKREVCPVYI